MSSPSAFHTRPKQPAVTFGRVLALRKRRRQLLAMQIEIPFFTSPSTSPSHSRKAQSPSVRVHPLFLSRGRLLRRPLVLSVRHKHPLLPVRHKHPDVAARCFPYGTSTEGDVSSGNRCRGCEVVCSQMARPSKMRHAGRLLMTLINCCLDI